MRKVSGILTAAAIALSSLAFAPAAHAESITGSGSSFAGKMFTECTAGYTKDSVVYNVSSSGNGQRDFTAGTTAFGASDAPYTSGQPIFKFTYVPAVAGPIAVAYNAPELKNFRLTPALISDIFLGNITKWNDSKIAAVNPGVKLPNELFNVVYRKDSSGTTNNFANFLSQTVGGKWVANNNWSTATGGTVVGIGGDKNTGVRAEMEKVKYSIGYLDLADALQAKFGLTSVQNGAKKFVKPDVMTARAFLASQKMNKSGIVQFDYKQAYGLGSNGKKTTNFYSMVLVAYAMAPTAGGNGAGQGAAKVAAAKDFLKYVVNTCVPQKGADLGYVAFSGDFLKTSNSLIALIK